MNFKAFIDIPQMKISKISAAIGKSFPNSNIRQSCNLIFDSG